MFVLSLPRGRERTLGTRLFILPPMGIWSNWQIIFGPIEASMCGGIVIAFGELQYSTNMLQL